MILGISCAVEPKHVFVAILRRYSYKRMRPRCTYEPPAVFGLTQAESRHRDIRLESPLVRCRHRSPPAAFPLTRWSGTR